MRTSIMQPKVLKKYTVKSLSLLWKVLTIEKNDVIQFYRRHQYLQKVRGTICNRYHYKHDKITTLPCFNLRVTSIYTIPHYSYLSINPYPNKLLHILGYISTYELLFEKFKSNIPFKIYEECTSKPFTTSFRTTHQLY